MKTGYKIWLVGFSGSGKSSVIHVLKKQQPSSLACDFIDLDANIEKQVGSSISDWVKDHSWEAFRELEKHMISELLRRNRNMVIALGGGAFHTETIKMIRADKHSRVIFFDCTFDLCWQRISGDTSRPLTSGGQQYMSDIYAERQKWYQESDYSIQVDSLSLDSQAEKVEHYCQTVFERA